MRKIRMRRMILALMSTHVLICLFAVWLSLPVALCFADTPSVAETSTKSEKGEAQALSVDWKLYGSTSADSGVGVNVCFYDANGVVHGPDGHIRVWTKCLSKKDMDSIDIKKDFYNQILENTADKIHDGYKPPYASVETTDFDTATGIIAYEETANLSDIEPEARIFYELNCPERMSRELSMYFQDNGKTGSRDTPNDWRYDSPETNGNRLLKLLCPLR